MRSPVACLSKIKYRTPALWLKAETGMIYSCRRSHHDITTSREYVAQRRRCATIRWPIKAIFP